MTEKQPSIVPYQPATKHRNGLRLLALDGGGIRGIVALVTLQHLMKQVQERKGLKETPRPVDYFELAGGTSTGGIIGIMLFRLRMPVDKTIEQYYKIGKEVFSPKVYGWNIGWLPVGVSSRINNSKNLVQDSRFDDADLKKAIDDVVAEYGLDETDRNLKGNAPLLRSGAGRTFCCTTAQNRAETVLLRSYRPQQLDKDFYIPSAAHKMMKKHGDQVTISLAARATSAAPTFFPEVRFPEVGLLVDQDTSNKAKWEKERDARERQLIFWDGGLLNNNPIDQLWYARYELVHHIEPSPAISCVISLGTGWRKEASPDKAKVHLAGVVGSVMGFSTNTNAKAKDFTRHYNRLRHREEYAKSQYIRFQPTLEDDIGLADYHRMAELQAITETYIKKDGSKEWIDKAVCAICCDGCSKC